MLHHNVVVFFPGGILKPNSLRFSWFIGALWISSCRKVLEPFRRTFSVASGPPDSTAHYSPNAFVGLVGYCGIWWWYVKSSVQISLSFRKPEPLGIEDVELSQKGHSETERNDISEQCAQRCIR